MSLFENVDACRHIARSVSIPVMADADTGYGDAVTVYHTVQYFEEAGVAGINIEDQVVPKRCGHMRGKELIDADEMALKIEAAVKARTDPDFIINARTDAIAVEGLDAAIRRAEQYAKAGADMVFPDGIGGEEDIRRFVEEVDAPVNINMGFGIRSRPTTPLIGVKRLEEIVDQLEAGDLELEAALAAFEQGVALARSCAFQLDNAERRIEVLVREGESWSERTFEESEEVD